MGARFDGIAMRNAAGEDRISYLPDEVLDQILCRLPLQEAGKTSVLSKTWRYKWRYLPSLDFRYDKFCCAWPGRPKLTTAQLLFKIFQVLLRHRGPLKIFAIDLPNTSFSLSCPELHQIISYISEKEVERLSIGLPGFILPSTLYSCLHLTHLHLVSCILSFPLTSFVGLQRLLVLDLRKVDIRTDVNDFVLKFPSLEKLKLHSCINLGHIELDAPNLLDFYYYGGQRVSIGLKNAPLLKYFQSLHDYFCHQNLSRDGLQDRSLLKLDCLERMFLTVCLGDRWETSWFLYLIRSSPNLEELTVMVNHHLGPVEDKIPVLDLLKAQSHSEYSLDKLREITLDVSDGTEEVLEFVQLFLALCPRLEQMVIKPENGKKWTPREALSILKKITAFKRASAEAKVIFRDGFFCI